MICNFISKFSKYAHINMHQNTAVKRERGNLKSVLWYDIQYVTNGRDWKKVTLSLSETGLLAESKQNQVKLKEDRSLGENALKFIQVDMNNTLTQA